MPCYPVWGRKTHIVLSFLSPVKLLAAILECSLLDKSLYGQFSFWALHENGWSALENGAKQISRSCETLKQWTPKSCSVHSRPNCTALSWSHLQCPLPSPTNSPNIYGLLRKHGSFFFSTHGSELLPWASPIQPNPLGLSKVSRSQGGQMEYFRNIYMCPIPTVCKTPC